MKGFSAQSWGIGPLSGQGGGVGEFSLFIVICVLILFTGYGIGTGPGALGVVICVLVVLSSPFVSPPCRNSPP